MDCEAQRQSVFWGSRVGWRWSQLPALKKQNIYRLLPGSGKLFSGLRALVALVTFVLLSVHPNPGPSRHQNPELKAARMERRKERRVTKRAERERVKGEREEKERERKRKETIVVTWNVQGMSMGERTKRKARAVAEVARKNGWEVVLLSEVRARSSGVV